MSSKHSNFKYDGNLPFFIGDRRYGQDIIKDFWSQISFMGDAMKGLCGEKSFLFSGGELSQGSSGVNIGELYCIIRTLVEVSSNFSSLPPGKENADISIPLYSAALSNISLSGATLDGSTVNYIKLSYSFTDGNTRSRAKKIGSYAYEGISGISISINSTAPTDYELSIGTVVGTSTSNYSLVEVGNRKDIDERVSDNKNYALGIPTTFTAKGSALSIPSTGSYPRITALSSKRIAYFDVTNRNLITYEFQISEWVQIGNALNLPTIVSGATDITALTSSRIALADPTNEELKAYDFDGTNWTQVGNALSITSLASNAISAISSSRIAFHDIGNDELRTYDFDGTNWTQAGGGLAVSATSTPYMCSLSKTRIAMRAKSSTKLNIYQINSVGVWSEVGGDNEIISSVYGVTALSPTRVLAGKSTGSLQVHEIIGEGFSVVSEELVKSSGTSFDIESLSPNEFVLVANNSIQLYEINFKQIPPSPALN